MMMGDNPMPYPGIKELTRQLDQEKIDTLSERVDALRTENDSLKLKIQASIKDTHDFVSYFQHEMESKDTVITRLNEELSKKETEFRIVVKEVTDSKVKEVTEIEEQSRATQKQLEAQVKMLEDELLSLERFRDMVASHTRQMEQLKALLQSKETEHQENMQNLERKYLMEKNTMRKDMELKSDEIARQARLDAHNSLSSETKRIVLDNKLMGEELRFQMQMTTELQADKTRLENDLAAMKLDLSLLTDRDGVYAKRGQSAGKELKRLTKQVEELQLALDRSLLRAREEKEQLRQDIAVELQDQTLDAAGLRRLLAVKNKELRQIRELSQYVLDQRTEVESFFLEALQEVRGRILLERKASHRKAMLDYNSKMREATRVGGKFPKITNSKDLTEMSDAPSALPMAPDGKVELKDLTWRDKEHILRLLFAKINQVQGEVKRPGAHTLEMNGQILTSTWGGPEEG